MRTHVHTDTSGARTVRHVFRKRCTVYMQHVIILEREAEPDILEWFVLLVETIPESFASSILAQQAFFSRENS